MTTTIVAPGKNREFHANSHAISAMGSVVQIHKCFRSTRKMMSMTAEIKLNICRIFTLHLVKIFFWFGYYFEKQHLCNTRKDKI